MSIEEVQMVNGKYRSRDDNSRKLIGPKYLGDNTVLNKNGFVNICPSGDQSVVIGTEDATNINANVGTRIEKCMFSIENLAWKDVPKFTKENYISKEQTGPNGGRIMWFPPYDLSFSENVNVAWNESTFIGRGEKVYTYTNTDRTGTLSFTLLIDHPSIVNSFARLNDGDLSSDIDSDILRYFAGCEIPEIKDSDDDNNKNKKDTDKGEEEIKRHEKFSFYVYFPNNFSGVVSDKSGNKIKKYDSDWWKYILVGNNCDLFRSNDTLGSDKNAWVGYEITKGEGISKHYDIENIDKELEKDWIGVSQCHWDRRDDCIGDISGLYSNDAVDKNGNEVVNKTNGNWCFKYKVDNDLRQKLGAYLTEANPTNVSFIDKESNQLNSKLNNKEFQKGADYTFGEVIAALLTAKKLNTKNSNNSMGNLSNIEADALLEFLLKNGCSTNSVKKLSKDFEADGLKIDSIKIFGSADSNDKKNSAMLAMRRAESIKRLFTEDVYEIKIDNSKIESSSQSSQSDPSKSANDKENKLQRYAFVTVEYSLPGTKQAWSSMSESATNKKEKTYEEEQEDENNFNTWFDFLLSNSEIISEYREIFDNEDYEYQYDLFKEDIKNWCIDNGISYDDAESVTEEEWISIINQIVAVYGYEYFIPAEKLTDYEDDFINQLNKHKPINSDANIDKKISEVNSEMVKLYDESDNYAEKASGLTNELTELNEKKQEKNLDAKISECEEKISCYTYGNCEDTPSGTTHYQSEIDRIKKILNE
jgi:RNA polymerase-binding transcription factor DksA